MGLHEQTCDHVADVDAGRLDAAGALDEVRGDTSLDSAFAALVGAGSVPESTLAWLGG
jgi:ABC-2 type transport system ATP-binding protein